MSPQPTVSDKYDARIRRAAQLISGKSSAAEILCFYKRIAEFQKDLRARIGIAREKARPEREPPPIRDDLDLALLLPHFGGFLEVVKRHAPGALASAAREIADWASDPWVEMLSSYWELGGRSDQQIEAFAQFFPRAFLQPYAEYLAEWTSQQPMTAPRVCPLCGARPLLGVLRPEGDGGKRHLVCSFCGLEWEFRRLLCPACGEEDEKKLPVYVAEQFPHIRVEACETCRFFIRTVDLTKDGHAVPLVDELAAVPLTLWAQEHAYKRLEPNLFGS
ncbi:MAG TPA: formate dehydrogenase accessory protein FdhE [Candidatus Acidoferrum sp.]|nr:formate dehydrogenase accessory protein FdhE [Candidatus Acidoferrum sp.]